MEGLAYVLVPAVILGVSWGLRVIVAHSMNSPEMELEAEQE